MTVKKISDLSLEDVEAGCIYPTKTGLKIIPKGKSVKFRYGISELANQLSGELLNIDNIIKEEFIKEIAKPIVPAYFLLSHDEKIHCGMFPIKKQDHVRGMGWHGTCFDWHYKWLGDKPIIQPSINKQEPMIPHLLNHEGMKK